MDKTIRQLTGDIKAGRNLEQALPELMNRMASAYGMLSYYNMNMELSVLLEAKEEGMIKPGRTVKELEEKLRQAKERCKQAGCTFDKDYAYAWLRRGYRC